LIEKLTLHQKLADDLFQEGQVRKSDLLETLSGIEEIRLKLNNADRSLENERIYFLKLCGYDPEDIDESYVEPPITQDAAQSYFETMHPVLASLRHQAEALALQKKIADGRYLPRLSGYAEVHYAKPGIDYFKKEWMLYLQGGVLLSLPVFDWNRLGREKAVLGYQERKLENQRKQLVRDVNRSLEQMYTSLRMLEGQQSHVDRLIRLSAEDARLKEALYREGQIPNVDYLAALLDQQKHELMKDEIRIHIEQLKVSINTLITRNREDGDG
jgi:outer membrane protein TolC